MTEGPGSQCFYCIETAVEVCDRCGASICEDHSTEFGECRDTGEDMALHIPAPRELPWPDDERLVEGDWSKS